MKLLVSALLRLRNLFRLEQLDCELRDELAGHLEMHIEDNLRAGMSPEEARRQALLELGGTEQIKESVRDQRSLPLLESIVQDFRYALRNFRKDRRFAFVSIFTLALGIGSTTAIFSVIDGALLNPYPYMNADRLASPTVFAKDQFRAWRFPAAAFADFKEQNHTFDDMFGLVYREVHFARNQGTEEFGAGSVTPGMFESLGIAPLLGRSLVAEDARPGAPPVFVINYNLWTKLFHRDPKILGTTYTINATRMTLVGIMPQRFQIGSSDLWLPLNIKRDTFVPGTGLESNEIWTVGHLKPGVTSEAAAADL